MFLRAVWALPRVGIAVAVVCAAFLGSFLAQRTFAQPNGNVIYACKGERSGTLRVVDGADDCERGEEPLSWNVQGPPGGVSGYIVTGTFNVIQPGSMQTNTAACPAGQFVVSGGIQFFEFGGVPPDNLVMVESYPETNFQTGFFGWTSTVRNTSETETYTVAVFATCVNGNT